MDIDGQSFLANLALTRLRYYEGDRAGFDRGADRILTLFPNDANALAMIGTWYAIMNDVTRAEPLIAKAAIMSPRPPGIYHVARCVIELREGRYESALEAALRLDAPNWFISPLVVSAAAALAGRDDVALRAREHLLGLYPDFEERARDEIEKWQPDARLLEELLRGLRAAGFEIA
jgi:hypothetical protein